MSSSSKQQEEGTTICLSNRAPYSIRKSEGGGYERVVGTGGLAAGLSGVENVFFAFLAVKNSFSDIPFSGFLLHNLFPIFVEEDDYDAYYNVFANSVVWPWLHEKEIGLKALSKVSSSFSVYKKVNKLAAKKIKEFVEERSVSEGRNKEVKVWVHDYHFFYFAKYFREETLNLNPLLEIRIGFFLHTYFPSVNFYKKLFLSPFIISALLKYDLIGFHIDLYLENFKKFIMKKEEVDILEEEEISMEKFERGLREYLELSSSKLKKIKIENRKIFLVNIPIGIDSSRFSYTKNSSYKNFINHSIKTKEDNDKFLILGIEREDVIKGILHKLEIFNCFLEEYPESHNKVEMIQVVVPSREAVEETKKLRKEILEKISFINGKYGDEVYVPIKLIYKPVKFENMVHLYRNSHCLFVCSEVDGFNLVAAEYLASQNKKNPGVILLSNRAGVFQVFRKGVLEINPYNFKDAVEKIYIGWKLRIEKRKQMIGELEYYTKNNVSQKWASCFLKVLECIDVYSK